MFEIDLSRFSDKTALIQDDTYLSYSELEKRCEEFTCKLKKHRQLVLLQISNTIKSVTAYLSFLRADYVVILIDPSLCEELKESICKEYQPNLIYSDEELLSYSTKVHTLHSDLSVLISTSGSTGSSKMIRLSRKNLYANTASILGYLPLGKEDVTITTLGLYYSYGLSILHTHLDIGATIVLSENSLISKEFWSEYEKAGITNINGVPYHYEMLKRIGFFKKEHKSLRFLTQAGGRLGEKLAKECGLWAKESGKKFFIMYGQSEASARISYLPPERLLEKPASIGIAIPFSKLDIREGELVYHSQSVMMGYALCSEDLGRDDELHGILKTGDLGYQDDEGYFYISGRAKRFVKIFGNRINLDEIESYLKQDFSDTAVVGDDTKITVLTTNNNTEVIKEKILDRYALHRSILHVKVVKNLIYKKNLKPDYQAMKELYL